MHFTTFWKAVSTQKPAIKPAQTAADVTQEASAGSGLGQEPPAQAAAGGTQACLANCRVVQKLLGSMAAGHPL